MTANINIGRIPILVCAPFFHRFLDQKTPEFVFTDGYPQHLNSLLHQGKIHTAPSSALEYAKAPEQYCIAPDICTSSTLEIRSVKLFSRIPWKELNARQVHLTAQSATSVALAKVLSSLHFHVTPSFDESGTFDPEHHDARVLIGDEALRESVFGNWRYQYDLAAVWQEWQNLPFVFGMWIIHRSALSEALRPLLNRFLAEMAQSVESFRMNRISALENWSRHYPSGLPWDIALHFHDVVDYRFTADRKESLNRFFACCAQIHILPRAPELVFLK